MISLVITPNGASVYVSTILNGVQVLATSTNTIIATVPVVVPVQSAVTPDGDFVYVPSAGYQHCCGNRHCKQHCSRHCACWPVSQ